MWEKLDCSQSVEKIKAFLWDFGMFAKIQWFIIKSEDFSWCIEEQDKHIRKNEQSSLLVSMKRQFV